ncbi:MAG: M23 family metallopeptidase [Myxococcota bacterium]
MLFALSLATLPAHAARGDACLWDTDCTRGLVCESAPFPHRGGYCQPPPGDWAYCTPDWPCDVGEGDCDTDADCETRRVCTPDTGARYGLDPTLDTCEWPLGHSLRCSPDTPCDTGEGDCDTDSDCLGGLSCQDTDGRYGWWYTNVQTCELPVGHADRCTPETPCDVDEGDCDSDADCLSGLVCRHDHGAVYGFSALTDVCVPPTLRCPEDWFAPQDRTSTPPRFRFPMRAGPGTLGPGWMQEPLFVHFDRAGAPLVPDGNTATFDGQHLTYDAHEGTDYPLAFLQFTQAGQTVEAVAAADGVVTRVVDGNYDQCAVDLNPWSPTYGTPVCGGNPVVNNIVTVCHADGTLTEYLHVMQDSAEVEVGDAVSCGDRLALVGSAGRSSGPHLHFDVRQPQSDGTTKFVDPYAANPSQSMWVDQGNVLVGYPGEVCE